ncbi:hypothetical protein SRHO_G00304780 [Serrasalmus rhombeus]
MPNLLQLIQSNRPPMCLTQLPSVHPVSEQSTTPVCWHLTYNCCVWGSRVAGIRPDESSVCLGCLSAPLSGLLLSVVNFRSPNTDKQQSSQRHTRTHAKTDPERCPLVEGLGPVDIMTLTQG